MEEKATIQNVGLTPDPMSNWIREKAERIRDDVRRMARGEFVEEKTEFAREDWEAWKRRLPGGVRPYGKEDALRRAVESDKPL